MERTLKGVKEVHTLLKLTYGLVPIVAGADKFANLLTNWVDYLSPTAVGLLPVDAVTFMMIVGVIEIVAGLLVLANPKVGGYVVAAWLFLVALSLLTARMYYDVAIRDLVMAVGAYSLARLSSFNLSAK